MSMSVDYAVFRRAIEDDSRGIAHEDVAEWLREPDNLVPWLRTLRQISQEVETHIAKDRASLADLRPKNGKVASLAYLEAKAEHDQRTIGRLHFMSKIRQRMAEAQYLLGEVGLTDVGLGQVIDTLVLIEVLLENGELDGAKDLLTSTVETFARRAGHMSELVGPCPAPCLPPDLKETDR